ncbi:Uncharacterised protein [Mycobacterium tuberculosis]|nr:Uncharacterised protein [Mycobacterium tuberculosis]
MSILLWPEGEPGALGAELEDKLEQEGFLGYAGP